jgi:hypothetical protein
MPDGLGIALAAKWFKSTRIRLALTSPRWSRPPDVVAALCLCRVRPSLRGRLLDKPAFLELANPANLRHNNGLPHPCR